jgi:hypothetical protein
VAFARLISTLAVAGKRLKGREESPLKKKIPQTTYRAIEETFNELP